MQMENGTYAAKPVSAAEGGASVYESQGGALMLAIRFALEGGGQITARVCLVNKDGALNTKNIERCREWSGWDGSDPYWFMETDLSGIDVELVVENEEYEGKTFPSVKWINKPGSGGGKALPDAADRKAVLAKYGAKFRAVAGGVAPVKPVAPAAPAPAAPPIRKPAAATAATQATAWAKFQAKFGNLKDNARDELWFTFVDATGMDQADMTPAGWAQVETAIAAHTGPTAADMPF